MYVLAVDQGTTSSRAMLFDRDGRLYGVEQQAFDNHYPADGWVEQDPADIWRTVLHTCRVVIADAGIKPTQVVAMGLTNQRETTLVWDRASGEPIYPAIVWQDRRTSAVCRDMRQQGHGRIVSERTGLLLDPYFSATKLQWILDHVEGARQRAEAGELAFGTVDTYLLWRFNGGKRHVTDATNASRTMLFNIHEQCWDDELLSLFRIPRALLPEVLDSAADFGHAELVGAAIPILGVAGDQQAATIGQACFEPGMVKSTYGTGCFVMMNTGERAQPSQHRLLTTVAYRLAGQTTYALEGSIFMAGAAVQWLRDKLGLIQRAEETGAICADIAGTKGVYCVPAFAGLGAPYWDAEARGALVGLTQDAGRDEIVRATLEAVAYQTCDLLQAMADDGMPVKGLRVDGGMVVNNWLMQFLADILNVAVERPRVTETTALGAAALAAFAAGWFESLPDAAAQWHLDRSWQPDMAEDRRKRLLAGWHTAVKRVRSEGNGD